MTSTLLFLIVILNETDLLMYHNLCNGLSLLSLLLLLYISVVGATFVFACGLWSFSLVCGELLGASLRLEDKLRPLVSRDRTHL